jgi:hypothetical protein
VIAVTASEWDESKFCIETLKETLELRVDAPADKAAWADAIAAHKAHAASVAAARARRGASAAGGAAGAAGAAGGATGGAAGGSGASGGGGGASGGSAAAADAPPPVPPAAAAAGAAITAALAAPDSSSGAATPAGTRAFVAAQLSALCDSYGAALAAERRRRGALRQRVRTLQADKALLERTVVAEAFRADAPSSGSGGAHGSAHAHAHASSGAPAGGSSSPGAGASISSLAAATSAPGGGAAAAAARRGSGDDGIARAGGRPGGGGGGSGRSSSFSPSGGVSGLDNSSDEDDCGRSNFTGGEQDDLDLDLDNDDDLDDEDGRCSLLLDDADDDVFFECAADESPAPPGSPATPSRRGSGGSMLAVAASGYAPPWGAAAPPPPALPHARRALPPPVERGGRASLWSVVKDAVGRDLTRVTLPVTFNEPLSALQKFAEELEYSELLDAAAAAPPRSRERLLLVAAFSVSGYASAAGRTLKPFNPLERETYEYVNPAKGFRFLGEKVRHHPLHLAAHACGRGWTFWGETAIRTKFWGRCIELVPSGCLHASFADGDTYTWRKVPTTISNIILGPLSIDYAGTTRVVCAGSGEGVKLRFKEAGLLDNAPHQVRGTLEKVPPGYHLQASSSSVGRSGDAAAAVAIPGAPELHGAWNAALWVTDAPGAPPRLLWRRAPGGAADAKYNFGAFAVTLNEPPPSPAEDAAAAAALEGVLCPTDSRLRPDQRLLEQGRYTEANVVKLRLEDNQRVVRKRLAEQGLAPQPRWFRPVPMPALLAAAAAGGAPGLAPPDESGAAPSVHGGTQALAAAPPLPSTPRSDAAAPAYAYVGGYWEARERRDWAGVPRIFDGA